MLFTAGPTGCYCSISSGHYAAICRIREPGHCGITTGQFAIAAIVEEHAQLPLALGEHTESYDCNNQILF